MTRQTFTIFFLTILFSCEVNKTDNIQFHSIEQVKRKKIKSIKTYEFINKNLSDNNDKFESKEYEKFDTLGNRIEYIKWIIDSSKIYYHQWKEIQQDTIIEIIMNRGNIYRDSLVIREIIKYFKGRQFEKITYSETNETATTKSRIDSLPWVINTFYDTNEQISFTKSYYNEKTSNTKYFYKDTLLTSKKIYDSQTNDTVYSEEYLYDYLGRKINENIKDLKQSIYFQREYYYDTKGRKIKQVEDDPNDVVYVREYEYNSNDSLTKMSWYQNGNLFSVYEYEYDSVGNLILEKCFEHKPMRLSLITQCIYNRQNLLVQKTRFGDNLGYPVFIEYYYYDTSNHLIEIKRFVAFQEHENGPTCFDRRTISYHYEYY